MEHFDNYKYKVSDLVRMNGTLQDLYTDYLMPKESIGMIIKIQPRDYSNVYLVLFGERVCGVMEQYLDPYSE